MGEIRYIPVPHAKAREGKEWGIWDFKREKWLQHEDGHPLRLSLKGVKNACEYYNRGFRLTRLPRVERAKTIKRTLKKAFPGVKFSVVSRSYSGGHSIDINWVDGPSYPEIQTITNQFRIGLSENSHQYLFEKREWTEETRQLIEDEIKRTHALNNMSDFERKDFIRTQTWRIFYNTSFYNKENMKPTGITWNDLHKKIIWIEDKKDDNLDWSKIVIEL